MWAKQGTLSKDRAIEKLLKRPQLQDFVFSPLAWSITRLSEIWKSICMGLVQAEDNVSHA